jgi:lipopolysaccharide/colanic/teichoic acid biosynthesis glycosyltransferase
MNTATIPFPSVHADETPVAFHDAGLDLDQIDGESIHLPVHDAPADENDLPIRPVADKAISLALERFRQGQLIIEPLGNQSHFYSAIKRAADIVGAVLLIIMLSPILLTTWLLLCVTTKGNPIFVQERVGYCGKRFRMIKFRTMRLDADKVQHLVVNEKDGPIFKNRRDPRVTRIGRILRSTSIDEMPQLFNVLSGSMSLVGPRPPIAKEVEKYEPWQRRRLAVKPGLTCLWQVSGRSEVAFEDWVRMDLWYLKNQNLATDAKLLAKTPASVVSGRGAF